MSKLFRSLVWTGFLAVGLAACGDDVTVQQPPPPPPPPVPGILSVQVGPDGASIQVGATQQMTAAVTTEPGAATPTIVWSTSDASKASVSAGGLVTGVAAGAAGIRATATSGTSVGSGVATVNVVAAPTCVVSSVVVTPGAADMVLGQTIQASAAVNGTAQCAATVTWSSLTPAVASVSAGGLITALAAGNAVIKATSVADGTKSGSAAVTVRIPDPATLSIQSITAGGLPIALAAVAGQIEVALNVDNGEKVLDHVDVLIGGKVVASQSFTSAAPAAAPSAVPVTVVLNVNTRQLRRPTGSTTLYVPVIFNGQTAISARLYVVGSSTPIASNAVPVVMTNADAALKNGAALTLVNNSTSPSFTNITGTWYTGTQTGGSIQYVAFGTVVPTALAFGSSVCGASTSNNITGDPLTGIVIGANWTCAGVEGGNTNTGVGFPATTLLAGPDGTVVVPAPGYSNVGTSFLLPNDTGTGTEDRFNMITGTAPTVGNTVLVDNKAPVVTVSSSVAFNTNFDQLWVKGDYNLESGTGATDAGTGVASKTTQLYVGASCSGQVVTTPAGSAPPLVESTTNTLVGGAYQICGSAVDNIGNASGSTGPSNVFGYDNVAGTVRFVTGVLPGPPVPFAGSALANQTSNISVAAPAGVYGLEAIDSRSGFMNVSNVLTNGSYPFTQSVTRLAPGGAGCAAATANVPPFTALGDNYIRSTVIVTDCAQGVGYYWYSGSVTDRAGNVSSVITRNIAVDPVAPVASSIGLSTIFYTAGASAPFYLFGSDDLEVIEADLGLLYGGMQPAATMTGIQYPLNTITGAARWDGSLNNIMAGTVTSAVSYLLGRIDHTCTGGAGLPYGSCLVADGTSADLVGPLYNNVGGFTSDEKNPTSVSAVLHDVFGTASNTVTTGILTAQTNDVAQPWSAADIVTWKILSTAGPVTVEHMASTSIVVPFFDQVLLARQDLLVAPTTLVVCGTYGPPALTDNGANRFWTYSIVMPTTGACAAATGGWVAIGIKSGAALVTQALP